MWHRFYNYYDTIYIGAGPANIFSLLEYPNSDALLIEQGKPLPERTNILEGFAGAGCFSDSKLVRSGRVTSYCGEEFFTQASDKVLNFYNKFSDDLLKWKEPSQKIKLQSPLYFISSPVCHVGSDRGRIIFERMQNYIQEKICPIHFEEQVINIFPENNRFLVCTNKTHYFSKRVVLGTGVRDFLLKSLLSYLHLNSYNSHIQIGVRVEIPDIYLKELVDAFYDFKIALDTKLGYWRTFCVNSGAAYVVVEHANGYFSANGHAYHNKPSTHTVNFGVLGQLNLSLSVEQQISMAKKINQGNSGVLAQNISDFLIKKSSKTLNFFTTVESSKWFLGNLWNCLDSKICMELQKFFTIFQSQFDFEGHFFAPEINLVQPRVYLSPSLEAFPNLFLAGDILITRSIVDAGVSGMWIGQIINTRRKTGI